ncbi:hypothetical protein [Mammaliicoccus lentus]|uniref:hypothetical protein n=1 Tax=Mammaliicoccus lentus TaxID=42858 RepID=UPI003CFB7D3B
MEELLKDIKVWQLIWTIIVGFIGAILNGRLTAYKVRAELKAKTRLQWIEEVRTITSEIIVLYYEYMIGAKQIFDEFNTKTRNVHDIKQIKKIKLEILDNFYEKNIELIANFNEKRNLYKLYFSPYTKKKWYEPSRYCFCNKEKRLYKSNEINKKMHKLVDNIFDDIVKAEEKLVNDMVLTSEKETHGIFKFSNETSFYLKVEWDRAKRNK